MSIRLGVVMDPISQIKVQKDSTFAMLLAAQRRGWRLSYLELADLSLQHDCPVGRMRALTVDDRSTHWFHFGAATVEPLAALPVILMRKDPPFDLEYIVATYLLEAAEARGTWVINRPGSLRDANEKLFALQFPDLCPPTRVSRRIADLRAFYREQGDIILKPLDGMGGASVFRVRPDDPNLSVILETLTNHGQRYVMAQRFIPEIQFGDKRVLLINGAAVPYALARIPAPGETRGNLAAGGTGVGMPLTAREYAIAAQVGPVLKARGIVFAGLDIIGDYLTEINITSPTGMRELERTFDLDLAGQFMDIIAAQLAVRTHSKQII